MPDVKAINIDKTDDMNEIELIMGHDSVRPLGPVFN